MRDRGCLRTFEAFVADTLSCIATGKNRFNDPSDMQSIKACGATFAVCLIELVIEKEASDGIMLFLGQCSLPFKKGTLSMAVSHITSVAALYLVPSTWHPRQYGIT
jgi:hypothetical protein